ncbi:hypothetical protein J5N97_006166 [Dioscorea zingiberensis]|uniref:Uncharacterized protein n=1 Tax=Dioscorea zingiberensis TaxID=325984 RepID=A0A9D5HSJ4_9LILI|nr:hypothetical protein J5N97_006166 [Dioscorea zingiberensis]
MANNVSTVYIHVIDDVINKVRDEFVSFGAGETVLSELQTIWEMKMLQCGAISGVTERQSIPRPGGPITPVHDLNVPYEGPPEEYETPTAEMLFPPTPLQTPIQTPLPGTAQTPLPGTAQTPLPGTVQTPLPGMVDQSMYNIPTGSSDFGTPSDVRNGIDAKSGKHSPYMQSPSPWISPRPVSVDVNVAYVEARDEAERGASHQSMTQDFFTMPSGKRKRDDYAPHLASGGYIPQQDGSGDVTMEFVLLETTESQTSENHGRKTAIAETLAGQKAKTIKAVPQLDGINDEYDDLFHFQGVATEDYNTPGEHVELRAPTPSVATPKPTKNETADDDEPPLNEDDDDDDEEYERGEEEPTTQHLVLAQFDKVSRTKSRWKCTLKDGIMHINSRDILFNKATGEFDF